ncbi:hypothetical protein SRHO_G00209020 [Serrasalmus rhombeus]
MRLFSGLNLTAFYDSALEQPNLYQHGLIDDIMTALEGQGLERPTGQDRSSMPALAYLSVRPYYGANREGASGSRSQIRSG